ncbi:4'-phosphopantetheinyl transferase EntD [Asanoa ferruginea]|uniref:4'-phosphopantetheinyl transferase EntD n=1 Tax=Asanoa ferruginea TaxID=53367 RepID=A0A3D9ZLY9_9ACTN|nr:4'-phosphopantetheinyl transferase EntD [Asanoa ferruginea]GIF50582.1 putative 4'-phosphopantetheinyl transferase [Asanoa ferruginea]
MRRLPRFAAANPARADIVCRVPPLLTAILPPSAVAAERRDDADPAPLFPGEAAAVADAVDSRRREFATGRLCAREALRALGLPAAAVPRGDGGAPVWPPGVVGSVTHCAGYRGAAVARAGDLAALGIDAEPDEPLPAGVLDLVAGEGELAGLPDGGPHWDRLLFCAKEALYKAWYPLARRWLGFEEAWVTLAPDGTFTARVLVEGAPVGGGVRTEFAGTWLATPGLLLAAVAVPTG